MKHAWFGFVALVSGAVFLWLGADLICPADTAMHAHPTSQGTAIQWDYHYLAFEWRSEDAVVRDMKMIPISDTQDYSGLTIGTGTLGSGTDYMLILIPIEWALIAAGLLPAMWLFMKLNQGLGKQLIEHRICYRCGHEMRASLDSCPVCGESVELPEMQTA